MQAKLGEVISSINTSITEKKALITNDDLPVIIADDTQMYQMLAEPYKQCIEVL